MGGFGLVGRLCLVECRVGYSPTITERLRWWVNNPPYERVNKFLIRTLNSEKVTLFAFGLTGLVTIVFFILVNKTVLKSGYSMNIVLPVNVTCLLLFSSSSKAARSKPSEFR